MSRILVVDDEPHIADGLRFNLQAEGHDVTVTYDGEQALALLLEGDEPFDVVILDVMLPGKDGFETAAELRAAGQYVPILMLTARGRADDVLRGFEAGADDYLQAVRTDHPPRARQRPAPPPPLERARHARGRRRRRRLLRLRRAGARFRRDGGAGPGPIVPADADGE